MISRQVSSNVTLKSVAKKDKINGFLLFANRRREVVTKNGLPFPSATLGVKRLFSGARIL